MRYSNVGGEPVSIPIRYTLRLHRNISVSMKHPLLFHKKINRVFANAEAGVEPCAGAARSQVLWAGTAGTPEEPDTSQANRHLQPLHLPQMSLPALTLFTKSKTIFTPRNECDLGRMPGKSVEKKLPLIYLF